MAKFLSMTALLALLSITTATAQWVVKLPQPTGPYAVGATRFSLVDTACPETFTEEPSDHRELLIRVWYPAKPASRRASLRASVRARCLRAIASIERPN